jgi:thiamine biosynthesis lipoprotein
MGMQVRVVLYATDEAVARAAAGTAFAEIARLDAVFSDYRADSEIARLAGRSGHQQVSEELFFVLQRATRLARQTGGAFDPTVGALTALWREAIDRQRLPQQAEIDSASRRSGYDKLALDSAARTVEITAAGLRLDLGAIAKGYILDHALAVLREAGADRALVEAGGDIVAGAPPPARRGWSIDVPHLSPAGEGRGCNLSLVDAAVSTSGDHAQFIEMDGRRYSHTVDPRTGLGLTHRRTATVVAADGLTADGLATALTIVEEARMGELLEHYPSARAILSAADCR